MDKLSNWISVIYGILLAIGGTMGYVKSHSTKSFTVGLISGLLIFLAVKLGSTNSRAAYLFTASLSLILATFFVLKFSTTHALFPAGIMGVLSTLAYVTVARGWFISK